MRLLLVIPTNFRRYTAVGASARTIMYPATLATRMAQMDVLERR